MKAHDSKHSKDYRTEHRHDPIQVKNENTSISEREVADSNETPAEPHLSAAAASQDTEDAKKMMKSIHDYTLQISQSMEKSRIAEYNELLFNPRKLIWINLMGGAARGVGIAIGFTIFTAIIVYILQYLGALNLPIIGDFIADIVRIVQHQLDTKFY